MKFHISALVLLSASSTSIAFTTPFPKQPSFSTVSENGLGAALVSDDVSTSANRIPDKPIYDPMGLYPKNSYERQQGLIVPEAEEEEKINGQFEGSNRISFDSFKRIVTDPLNLYTDKSEVTSNPDMSASLPFLPRPEALDGTLPGDRGFDPLNLSAAVSTSYDNDDDENSSSAFTSSALEFYRSSELKHGRIAMLAAVGWPMAELFHNNIASIIGQESILNLHHQVPSVLNGGLEKVSPIFWASALAIGTIIEICSGALNESGIQSSDLGFDPLDLGGRALQQQQGDKTNKYDERSFFMQEAEIFNGRLAMLAITGFAIQEWFTNNSVVDAIPIFFKPMNVAMEQLLKNGGVM